MENKQISEELEQLMVFKGTWKVQGKNLSGAPSFANEPMNGTQKVEMLGSKFLVANWNYKFNKNNEHIGVSIIGKDNDSSKPKIHLFDNGASFRDYELNIDGNLWNIKGETERSTMEFAKDGKTYKELWEIKKDGKWEPLCDRNGTKV